MTRKSSLLQTHPEALRAEREGDFARARALSHKICQGARASGAEARDVRVAQDRLQRLNIDPVAWQVGVAALGAYLAAWFYAITANR